MSAGTDKPEPSAKERLAASRAALMRELQPASRTARSASSGTAAGSAPASTAPGDQGEDEYTHGQADGLWSVAKRSVQAWWEFHPARAAVAIAQPVVAEYAQRRPWKLMAVAAGVGAVLVVVRPWKLVSLGGIAVAALKSSQVSNLALSLLAARTTTSDKKDHE
ncbi:MAG: hypothetical protein V4505_09250 [Pseudomonadota bacterium]